MRKKVSICLLTYNHEHVIDLVVNSILNQNHSNYDIYISDDCSTDGTWERLTAFKRSGNVEIVVLKTPKNLGMAANANFAITRIDSPYIALLHHDDICSPELIGEWSGVMDRNPSIGFVFNQYGILGTNQIFKETFSSELIEGKVFLESKLFPSWNCIVRGTAMIRKDAWDQVGGLRPEYGLLADIDLWMRLSMIADVGYVNKPLIYVHHDRPADYPDEYRSEVWSWKRWAYLYRIHADNRLLYWGKISMVAKLNQFIFRLRLSLETSKWILYAILRKRFDMIDTCAESETEYDLFFLTAFRRLAISKFSSK